MPDKNVSSTTVGAEGSPAMIILHRFEKFYSQVTVFVVWSLAEILFRNGNLRFQFVGSSFS